ncbi:DUF1579 family protein [Nonomuraea sp. CA-143628]|uniref:DUF1579 family protein n=1 Tax=Nonomuraea sp. CA-143628 TaxID=3239997 RepID=UPI003D8CD288
MTRSTTLIIGSILALAGLFGTAHASAAPRTTAIRPSSPGQEDTLTPGKQHRRLDPLVGTWKATKYNWILGKNGRPIVSRDFKVQTRWITKTGGRFLEEKTEGTLGGRPYYRLGVMGYSNVDRRFEWTTFDSVTPTSMTYRGERDTGDSSTISIPGAFTDPGVLGPEYTGKRIPMRSVIKIESKNRHVFDLYFTPPGQRERLVDRVVYTRKAGS